MREEKVIRSNLVNLEKQYTSYKKIKEDLEKIINFDKKIKEEIQISFDHYINDVINQAISKTKEGTVDKSHYYLSFNTKNYDEPTVKKLYIYKQYMSLLASINKHVNKYNEYFDGIDQSVVNVFKGGLGWFFTGRAIKDASLKAADVLMDLNETSFYDDSFKYIHSFESISDQDYKSDFENDTKWYFDYLQHISTGTLYPQKIDFSKAKMDVDRLKGANERLEAFHEEIEKSKALIIETIDLLIEEESDNALRIIPIDDLNKRQAGIRVSTLKNAGYNTIYDIYKTTSYKLKCINGISAEGANEIKKIANEIKDGYKSSIKIRLSSENKSKISTRLIKHVYNYISSKEKRNRVEKIYNDSYKECKKCIKSSKSVHSEIDWILSSYNEKVQGIKSYNKVLDYLNNGYFESIYSIIRDYKEESNHANSFYWNDFEKNSASYYAVLDELMPGLFGTSDRYYGLPEELAKEIDEQVFYPDGLLCDLRPYQKWGVKYVLHQENVLLGDEMGLGKTVQAIATMVSLKNTGATHFIVVCPASVVVNWCREIQKHSKLNSFQVYGPNRQQIFNDWLNTGGVAVTNYETAKLLKLEEGFKYTMLVVDEAHYIKNPSTQRSAATIELAKHADRKLFMTGTALENKVEEMIQLVDYLQPPIASVVRNFTYISGAPKFREMIAPVYYRRKRDDVLTELPDKEEIKEWCTLNNEERQIYEDFILDKKAMNARRVSWNIDDLSKSSKAIRLKEIVEEAKSQNRKVIVFSFFIDTVKKIKQFLGDNCLEPVTGSMSINRRQEIIDEFSNASAGTVLPLQITAGGTGLNIQAASIVVIAEPQYKPSVENQAISRAYRMGQTRKVLVYRLLAENTIDEKITKLLESKQELFDNFADESVAAKQTELIDKNTEKNILQEEIDRILEERNIPHS